MAVCWKRWLLSALRPQKQDEERPVSYFRQLADETKPKQPDMDTSEELGGTWPQDPNSTFNDTGEGAPPK